MTVLKPFLLVACVAFVTGFAGYCALYRLANPPAEAIDTRAPLQAATSEPATPDDLMSAQRT